jgi:hypothetical protein
MHGERRNLIGRSTQRQFSQSQHGSDQSDVQDHPRLSVPAVALTAHARHHAVMRHDLAVGIGGVELTAVGVVDQSNGRPACGDGHAQGAQDQSDVVARRHRPTHHAPGVQIQQHRQIQPACPRSDKRDVAHPSLIGFVCLELPLQQIGRDPVPMLGMRRQTEAATPPREDAVHPAQSGNALAATGDAFGRQMTPHATRAVRLSELCMNALEVRQQASIGNGACTLAAPPPIVVAAARYPQQPAPARNACDHLFLDEGVLHPRCLAKYAAAFFSMSRASVTRASSRFRRSTSESSLAGRRPRAAKRRIAFATQLGLPLVKQIAPNPEPQRQLRDRLIAVLKQANRFKFEFLRVLPGLAHITPPGALSPY